MKDVGGAVLAGSTPPFLGRERAAVDVDVGPERRSPRYHSALATMRPERVMMMMMFITIENTARPVLVAFPFFYCG